MANATIVNFASGETSPKSRGRFDIASYNSSCRKLENFIAEVQGSARFRNGFRHLATTYNSAVARLIPFQFNDSQAYMLEFTPGRMRVYKDGTLIPANVTNAGFVPTATYAQGAFVRLGRRLKYYKSSNGAGLYFHSSDVETGVLSAALTVQFFSGAGALSVSVTNDTAIGITLSTTPANNSAALIQVALRAANSAYAAWYVTENAAYAADRPTTAAGYAYTDVSNALQLYLAAQAVTGNASNTSHYPAGVGETAYWEESDEYAIFSPYLAGELDDIFFTQSLNTMYLDHYAYAPRKLTTAGDTGWTLATYSRTADPLAVGAALTVTYIQIFGGNIFLYTPGTAIEGETYTLSGCEEIAEIDGNPYKLEFFTAYPANNVYYLLDPTTGDRVTTGTGAGTTAIVGGAGTPPADKFIAPAFYESRLVHAGTNQRPRTLFASRSPIPTTGVARYDDFTGGTDADHACFFSLAPVNGAVDYIVWAGGTTKFLLVGTFGGTFRVSGGGIEEPITPSSINVKQIDAFGCASIAPALNGNQAFFIQRGGKTLRGLQYSADVDDLQSVDMCLNADQIGDSELKRVVFQAGRPDALWVVRNDGQLAGCTIQGAERITGWHRHKIAGTSAKVLDVAVLPRTGGLSDQLYIVTERTVNGVTQRAVEAMADDTVFPDIEDYFTASTAASANAATYRAAALAVLKTAAHLDAYEVYNSTPATVISGLDHLIGETVTAVADGVEITGLTVSAEGTVTLDTAASIVVVGLPYTGLIQTQNLEVGGRSGPAQAKPRNINALNIRFLNSKGGKYGTDLYHMFDIDTEDPDALELADGSAAPVFNGIRALQHSDVWSTETDRNEKTVFIQQTKPFPCVVQFIDIEYETGDE